MVNKLLPELISYKLGFQSKPTIVCILSDGHELRYHIKNWYTAAAIEREFQQLRDNYESQKRDRALILAGYNEQVDIINKLHADLAASNKRCDTLLSDMANQAAAYLEDHRTNGIMRGALEGIRAITVERRTSFEHCVREVARVVGEALLRVETQTPPPPAGAGEEKEPHCFTK